MKILSCPLNGPRNIAEFIYGGQVKEMPDPPQQPISNGRTTYFMKTPILASSENGGCMHRVVIGLLRSVIIKVMR